MKYIFVAALLVSFASPYGFGQATARFRYGLEQGQVPSIEIPISFDVFRANAPPKGCACFWMYGGGAGMILNGTPHWSIVVDLASAHAGRINGSDQDLTIFNYQAGLRYSYRTHSRWTLYGQALVGGSEVFSNYAIYGEGRNYFSSTTGGGLNMRVSNHISITTPEASWMFSEATNGLNARQNNLKLSTGITLRFLSEK